MIKMSELIKKQNDEIRKETGMVKEENLNEVDFSKIKLPSAVDRLLKSLIITPNVNFNDLLIGDKNAIMVAARILGYGAEYEIKSIPKKIQEKWQQEIEKLRNQNRISYQKIIK